MDHEHYMMETNFTQSCSIMPWFDDQVRLIYEMEFKPAGSLNISGTKTIRPYGVHNQTTFVEGNIPYIIKRHSNNFQLRMVLS